jgi:hypothetical protein
MIDQLLELAEAQPFVPFTIVMRKCKRLTSTTFAARATSSSRTCELTAYDAGLTFYAVLRNEGVVNGYQRNP